MTEELEKLRKGWLDQAARDATEIVRLECIIEKQQDALQRIRQWTEAYPTSVFLPVSDTEVSRAVKLLERNGVRTDALYAEWARHIMHGIYLIVQQFVE